MDPLKNINTIEESTYPFLLTHLKKLPPSMEIIGEMPPETYKYLCVVGSRACSSYGKEACELLIRGLAGQPIVIVSGLAHGIDSIAHEVALSVGLRTIAFPGSGLDLSVLYPQLNIPLARRIVEAGGAIISPFKRMQQASFWTFPTRNTLMAGISNVTLVIEANAGSGSLITAKETSKISRDLLVVPGSIFSNVSRGSNELLRDGGIAVTCSEHILEALGLNTSVHSADEASETNDEKIDQKNIQDLNQNLFLQSLSEDERKLIRQLTVPIQRDEFIRTVDLPAGYVNAILTELELKGVIKERQGLLMVN